MTDGTGYEAVLQSLYERHRSVRDAGFSGDAYKPGLDAMLSYAEYLGHPERKFRSIHVAGTNGKGSVCSMLAAALAARGLRVGLYTSPHLVDFRERIKIIEQLPAEGGRPEELPLRSIPPKQAWAPPVHMATGGHGSPDVPPLPAAGHKTGENMSGAGGVLPGCREIPENAVCDFLRLYDRDGLTFFEVTTGMAFWWFAEEKVDVAVIETGLGGRLDSTNIITPEISVITSIGLDHCDLLGSTRAEIAAEKAGIFKPGVPALVWGRDQETQPVFERVAAEVVAPLYFAEDFPLPEAARDMQLDLIGPCQDLNLRTVLATLAIMEERDSQLTDIQPHTQNRLPRRGQSVSDKLLGDSDLRNTLPDELAAIGAAARITGFRGRWETLLTDPLTICDIGHNPPALAATFSRLAHLRILPPSSRKTLPPEQSDRGVSRKAAQGEPSPCPLGVQGDNSFAASAVDRKPLLVVYGAMKDKDVDAIATLFPTDAEYYLVQPDTPRSMPLEELALKLKYLNPIAAGSVRHGVELALERARRLPGAIVYIGGSTFVVSEAITYIESL